MVAQAWQPICEAVQVLAQLAAKVSGTLQYMGNVQAMGRETAFRCIHPQHSMAAEDCKDTVQPSGCN